MQQANYLARQCEAYVQANPFPFRIAWHEASDRHLAFLEGRKPPRYLGLILGEVVHDLRCALDHTAWHLAIQESGLETVSSPDVAWKIQFPIARTEAAFKNHRARNYFSEAAVETMGHFQPYRNIGSHLVNPLLVVQRLSNTDKDQALIPPSMGQLSVDEPAGAATEQISADDVEVLPTPNTVLDFSKPFLSIRASPAARIRVRDQYLQVCFQTDVTSRLDFILAEKNRAARLTDLRSGQCVRNFFPRTWTGGPDRELACA
ncbi:MAG TPA: hypothetical protein VGL78_05065 [Solirubrobacteraceae bacterium]|jgi:hypothetical protein